MHRTTYAVLGAFALLAAALPLEPREPQAPNPGGPTTPGINIPGQNGQPGFNLGPGGFNFGNPGAGGTAVTWGPGGLQISPGNNQPGVTIGTGNPGQSPQPKPPRRVLDEDEPGVEED